MFRITTATCYAFTFAEILIMAAINVASKEPVKVESVINTSKNRPIGRVER